MKALPDPYYRNGHCTIYHGDCREILPLLNPESVDSVVTDPPYGQSNEAYDKGVPVAVWAECYRIARPGAVLLSFAGSPTYHRIASDIEAAGFRVKQMWAWVYRDGFITSAYPTEGFDRLAPAFDPICYAAKGKVLLEIAKEGSNPWHKKGKREARAYSERSDGAPKKSGVGRYPTTLASDGHPPFEYFVLSRTVGGRSERAGHPNEKPIRLVSWLLSKVRSQIILDPYAGSGTTLLAAKNRGRKAIGIEVEEAYCEMAAKRLCQEVLPLDV